MPRKMKESDSQLLGLLPSNWECNVVRRCYNIILGKMLCPERIDESYSLEKYYCAANVHFDGVSDNGLKAMWFSPSEKREYGVREGDLLVVEGGAGAGGAAIAGRQRGFVGVQNSVMIVRPKKDADVRLLKYWLQVAVPSGYIDCVCNRATIPHFTKDKIGNMKIPYPPPAEQRRIAAYLDERCAKIDGMIAEAKASIEDYKKWKQSIIFEAVTGKLEKNLRPSGIEWMGDVPCDWRVERLQWHLEEVVEKNDPIRTTNILSLTNDRGVIPYEEKGDIGNKAKENFAEYKLAFKDTIVANSMNILIGSVGLSKYEGCVSPVYYVFKNRPNSSIRFFSYVFQMPAFQRELRRYANGILEIRLRVSASDILRRQVAIPTLSEQERIATFLDEKCAAIDKLVGEKESLIADLEAYKKSLIFETVTGKREVV
ncbi:MAG: restriction endonuclease subunit S [bacterium]|nr:restriction endonuclease subunit S [Candidatus Colisoma equi]